MATLEFSSVRLTFCCLIGESYSQEYNLERERSSMDCIVNQHAMCAATVYAMDNIGT